MRVIFTVTLPKSIRPKARLDFVPEEHDSVILPFQNIYAVVEASDMQDLLDLMHRNDFIVAREFNAKTKIDGVRTYEDRGEVIINCQFVGKIKPFFD
jgi:hypothetical protein